MTNCWSECIDNTLIFDLDQKGLKSLVCLQTSMKISQLSKSYLELRSAGKANCWHQANISLMSEWCQNDISLMSVWHQICFIYLFIDMTSAWHQADVILTSCESSLNLSDFSKTWCQLDIRLISFWHQTDIILTSGWYQPDVSNLLRLQTSIPVNI